MTADPTTAETPADTTIAEPPADATAEETETAETPEAATPVTPPVAAESPDVCVSCGTARVGPFCHACGEKRLDRHDYAFLHFAEHTVDTFTHLDVKVFKSLWSLVAKPGVMAADVLAGRRVRWAKPFQTFLIANLIFYLGATWLHVSFFDASLEIQLSNSTVRRLQWVAEAKAAALGQSMEVYAETYGQLSHTLSKTLVVLLVPLIAGILALLFWRKKHYFLEHVTVAALALSQFMLVSILGIYAVVGIAKLTGMSAGDSVMVPAILIANTALFVVAFRRSYPAGWMLSAVKGFAFTFLMMASVMYVFRPILFLITNAFT